MPIQSFSSFLFKISLFKPINTSLRDANTIYDLLTSDNKSSMPLTAQASSTKSASQTSAAKPANLKLAAASLKLAAASIAKIPYYSPRKKKDAITKPNAKEDNASSKSNAKSNSQTNAPARCAPKITSKLTKADSLTYAQLEIAPSSLLNKVTQLLKT